MIPPAPLLGDPPPAPPSRPDDELFRCAIRGDIAGATHWLPLSNPFAQHGRSNRTALTAAALRGHLDCARLILSVHGPEQLDELLSSATETDRLTCPEATRAISAIITERYLDLSRSLPPSEALSVGDLSRLLKRAAAAGQTDNAARLIAMGADPAHGLTLASTDDDSFPPPLYLAAAAGSASCVAMLSAHLLPDHDLWLGKSLVRAVSGFHEDAAEALASLGAAPSPMASQRTLLMLAASKGSMRLIRLAAPLCDPLAHCDKGRTALMALAASGRCNPEALAALLPLSDPEAMDPLGRRADEMALLPEHAAQIAHHRLACLARAAAEEIAQSIPDAPLSSLRHAI